MPPEQIPQSSIIASSPLFGIPSGPPKSPLQSSKQSLLGSLSQIPQLSSYAKPPNSPKQSRSTVNRSTEYIANKAPSYI